MKGTEKQIKYAKDIKARFDKEALQAYGQNEEDRAIIQKALDAIAEKYDDAVWWIEEIEQAKYTDWPYLESFARIINEDKEIQAKASAK